MFMHLSQNFYYDFYTLFFNKCIAAQASFVIRLRAQVASALKSLTCLVGAEWLAET